MKSSDDDAREVIFSAYKNAVKEINRLNELKDNYETKLIAPFAEVLAKKYKKENFKEEHIAIFESHLNLSEINDKEQYVWINYTDRNGDYIDHYIVSIPHLINCNFDEKDYTSNDERIKNENKKKAEENERSEYERLKKKYEG